MRRSLYDKNALLRSICVCSTLTLLGQGGARAQSVESFYAGKSINLIIGYPPAGANDVYARIVARHLGQYIPGHPSIIARNTPGAGSLIAASRIFNIEPQDGTTLGLLVPTIPLDEKLGNPAAKYHAVGFNWIGRLAPALNVTFIKSTSAVKTIADAFTKVAVLGATGKSATNSIYPTVLNNVLGTKFKIVNGYEGTAAAMIAMERGEVEGHSSTYDSLKAVHPDWIAEKKVNVIVQYMLHRHPDLSDVPTSLDVAKTDEQRAILGAVSSASEIGKFILTTPGVPADRVEALRRAFDAMVKDPEFIADAQKIGLEMLPLPGEELQQIVGRVQELTPELTEKVKAIYSIN